MNLNIDGVDCQVLTLGDRGENLLLMHGWGPASVSAQAHLLPLAQALCHRHRVTLFDFPGHGKSGMPKGDWGVAEYAGFTLQLMDALAIHSTRIIAHSFGGRVALHLAANHPQRVSAMVLTGCAGLRPKRSLTGRLNALLFKVGRRGLGLLSRIPPLTDKAGAWLAAYRKEMASADYLATPEALRGSFSKVVREDLRPLLSQIDQPTLLVWGQNDTATPLYLGQEMQREMNNAELLVYQSDDHWAYKNQLARFVNAADAFFEKEETA